MDETTPEEYHLDPGYIYFSRIPAVVRTVVGSCVAVCLWDPERKHGGISHFMYPFVREPSQATAQYGNVAIAALVRIMEEAGSENDALLAQIVGGASPGNKSEEDVGTQNVTMARKMLKRKRVTVVSEDVGGMMGRKLVFSTDTGELAILKVRRLRDTDWIR